MKGRRERLTHAEIIRILADQSEAHDAIVLDYLYSVAESFTVDEAFSVIALVDTPDVFE